MTKNYEDWEFQKWHPVEWVNQERPKATN